MSRRREDVGHPTKTMAWVMDPPPPPKTYSIGHAARPTTAVVTPAKGPFELVVRGGRRGSNPAAVA